MQLIPLARITFWSSSVQQGWNGSHICDEVNNSTTQLCPPHFQGSAAACVWRDRTAQRRPQCGGRLSARPDVEQVLSKSP